MELLERKLELAGREDKKRIKTYKTTNMGKMWCLLMRKKEREKRGKEREKEKKRRDK